MKRGGPVTAATADTTPSRKKNLSLSGKRRKDNTFSSRTVPSEISRDCPSGSTHHDPILYHDDEDSNLNLDITWDDHPLSSTPTQNHRSFPHFENILQTFPQTDSPNVQRHVMCLTSMKSNEGSTIKSIKKQAKNYSECDLTRLLEFVSMFRKSYMYSKSPINKSPETKLDDGENDSFFDSSCLIKCLFESFDDDDDDKIIHHQESSNTCNNKQSAGEGCGHGGHHSTTATGSKPSDGNNTTATMDQLTSHKAASYELPLKSSNLTVSSVPATSHSKYVSTNNNPHSYSASSMPVLQNPHTCSSGHIPKPPHNPRTHPGGHIPKPPHNLHTHPGGLIPKPPHNPRTHSGSLIPKPPHNPHTHPGDLNPKPHYNPVHKPSLIDGETFNVDDDDDDDEFWTQVANTLDEADIVHSDQLMSINDDLIMDELFRLDEPPSSKKVCSQEDIERKRTIARRKLHSKHKTF